MGGKREAERGKSREAKESLRVKRGRGGPTGMKIARRRRRVREREGDVPLYERSEFKLLFLLPLRERREGEVFVLPYKSQYPLVSAVERERTKIAADGRGE